MVEEKHMNTEFSEDDQRRIEAATFIIAVVLNEKLDAIDAGVPGACITEIEQAAMVMLSAYTGELPPLPIGAIAP
jgi:hypothetical protein